MCAGHGWSLTECSHPAQAMEDTTGGLWASGALRNKPAGLFTSTATQGGGQEATCLTGAPCLEPLGFY